MDKEVGTRFVRGDPVRHWFKPSGERNVALNRVDARVQAVTHTLNRVGSDYVSAVSGFSSREKVFSSLSGSLSPPKWAA
jgi:hypothetical protein